MKAKYFSPDSKHSISSNTTTDKKLRSVGSTSKLLIYTSKPEKTQQRIGRYTMQLNKLIGQGFSSKVYRGYQTDNKESQCAIKEINLENYRSFDLELLQNEISILKQLDHPNIIEIFEVIRTESFCYIITQYCQENDLNNTLMQKGKLNQEQALVILHDIIEGYKYLIKNDIIHRDLKPANILKGKFNWKIADFGFAVKHHSQYKAKNNVGTPLYMPPESLVRNIYSAKTDIFAIGIIFYEMLTGTTPWHSKTQKQLLRKMLNHPFYVPSQYFLSQEVQNILNKLCCVDLKRRIDKDVFLKFSVYTVYNESILQRGEITITQDNPEKLGLSLSTSLNLAALISPKNQIRDLLASQNINKKLNFQDKKFFRKKKQKNNMEQNDQIAFKNKFILINHKQKSISQQDIIYNNKIIVNQLQFCRYIYYLIKNRHVFCLLEMEKVKLTLLLFKHLLKLIKIVSDNTRNGLELRCWQQFIDSKRYKSTRVTLLQYLNRYELDKQIFLSSLELEQQAQAQEEILSQTKEFTIQEYQVLKNKVTQWIRIYIVNLDKDLTADLPLREVSGKIQGVRSLVAYRKLLQISMSHFKQFDYFQKYSNIKVHTDYQSVTSATKPSYKLWKRQINFL